MSSKSNHSGVYVVIPNWNGAGFITKCLTSLLDQTLGHQIVVVDNGSLDKSVELIKTRFPSVKILEFQDNAGFAGGVNRGIRHALEQGAEYIALLNNDAVAHKDWLKFLAEDGEANPNAGIMTSKIMRSDKTHLDSTGECYTTWGLPYPRGRNHRDNGQFDNNTEIFGASGGASLYRAELFKQIGLFDEDYFAYYEDVDISFRAQMTGWKVRYVPNAEVYHDVGGTSSKMGDFARYHSAKNFLLLYARNMPTKLYLKYFALFSLQFCRMLLTSIARGKFHVFVRGTWAAVKLHGATRRIRKYNLSRQKVPMEYIDSMLTHARPPRIPAISQNQ